MLARNTLLNTASQLLPLLVAIPILPYVLHGLGAERFAVLTLAWTVISYFGFVDVGLGRAATKLLAGLLGAGRRTEVGAVVWSALSVQVVLGVAGALVIAALAPVLTRDVLRISDPHLLAETRTALTYVALALPLVILSGTFSGVLEAHQRFDIVTLVRTPTNLASLVVPALGVMLAWSLPAIVIGVVAARVISLVSFAVCAARIAGGLQPERPQRTVLGQLLRFGGWLTVSLVAGPLIYYAERLIIGGVRSLTELAHYAVAFEIVARLSILPAAMAMTLFPAFSHAATSGHPVDELFRRPVRLLFLLQWPLLVVLWLFAADILRVWVGPEVSAGGAPVMRLLALAFFFNGFAYIALAGVQGLGRPDLKARLDLVQVPLFIAIALALTIRFGISGAAAAKLLVSAADAALLFAFARHLSARRLLERSASWTQVPAVAAGAAVVVLVAVSVTAPLPVRVVVACVATIVLNGLCWRYALLPADRAAVRSLLFRSVTAVAPTGERVS